MVLSSNRFLSDEFLYKTLKERFFAFYLNRAENLESFAKANGGENSPKKSSFRFLNRFFFESSFSL